MNKFRCPLCTGSGVTGRLVEGTAAVTKLGRCQRGLVIVDAACGVCKGTGALDQKTHARLTKPRRYYEQLYPEG